MHQPMGAAAILVAVLVGGCSTGRDLSAISYVLDEWGAAPSDATVPVMVGAEQHAFKVWVHKTKPKVMVQTASVLVAAGTGIARGLTLDLIPTDPASAPYFQAAADYLNKSHGPGCRLMNPKKITAIAYESDFDCSRPTHSGMTRR